MGARVFYSDGLRFECTRCSRCCRHTPGYVFLSENDVERLDPRSESTGPRCFAATAGMWTWAWHGGSVSRRSGITIASCGPMVDAPSTIPGRSSARASRSGAPMSPRRRSGSWPPGSAPGWEKVRSIREARSSAGSPAGGTRASSVAPRNRGLPDHAIVVRRAG